MNIMLIVFILIIGVCMINANLSKDEITAFDYHTKMGIPTATALKRAEQINFILDASGMHTIVGGAYTDIAEVPYQVGLVISLILFLQSACGGSLISNNRVLTAAHCASDGILDALSFTVVLGSNRLFYGGLRTETEDFLVHPDWNPKNLKNDLCILRIPFVSFTNLIQPIALPTLDGALSQSETFTGWVAVASGYGLTSDNSSIQRGQRLSSVKLIVIRNNECEDTFGSTLVQNSTICTSGAGGQSTCRGDSGGPLAVYVNHFRILIGVTSFGVRTGCEAGYPAAYSRVSYFISWIINQ